LSPRDKTHLCLRGCLALLACALILPASAQNLAARLSSLTGTWTGPTLDKNGVPKGYVLRDDIQWPAGPDGLALADPPGPAAWPDGVVPFQFDANVSAANRAAMLVAMDEVMKDYSTDLIHLAFVPRGTHTNYLHIQNSGQNSSAVGMSGGGQTVNIYNWDFTFIMAHELGHALGLWHEQSRPDRNTYVTIHLENVETGKAHNFNVQPDWLAGTLSTTYDFSSMMHYDATAFSTNGQPTIVANPGYDGSGMGQTDHISDNDFDDLYHVGEYGGGGSGYVDYRSAGAGAGTLTTPWSGVMYGAAQNLARQVPNPRSRLWVQGGHNYAETGRLAGPQRILAMPGTGTARIGP
jgi:hypothetical protein